MASIHPSRIGLVPQSDSPDSGDQTRERELRERLMRSRENRTGDTQRNDIRQRESHHTQQSNRRRSPEYEGYNHSSERRDNESFSRTRSNRYFDSPRDRNNDLQSSSRLDDQERRTDSLGTWDRRQQGRYQERFGNGDGFLQSRQEQRKASTFNIWPPSPKSPYREEEKQIDERNKRKSSSSAHKSHSHRQSHRSSHKSADRDEYAKETEEERERRHRHRRRERSRERRCERNYDSEEEERRRKRRKEKERKLATEYDERHHSKDKREESRSRKSKNRDSPPQNKEGGESSLHKDYDAEIKANMDDTTSLETAVRKIGPELPKPAGEDTGRTDSNDARAYGKALLPGEGTAMANFVQEGKRIPRRGEIGLTSDQIEAYENAGFVMSGSRHHRMNAVRMRKENQVYSAEEQRSMLKMIAEEKQKKEVALVEQFKEMVDSLGDD